MKNIRFTALWIVCLGSFIATVAEAAGGTIVSLDGSASLEHAGLKSPAAESTPVMSGDTLTVAEDGKAQVHFEDDSVFAIPGTAKFRVDEFRMPTANAGGSAIYTLQEGGFRTITGKISKGSSDKYEMRTEQATITVNGSAYSTLICNMACAKRHPAGLYVKAESGIIIVTNAGGQLKLKAGQIAFVKAGASTPVRVKISPFGDPKFAAEYGFDLQFDTVIQPPRIEQEPSASPS
jgi:hypothetical protein